MDQTELPRLKEIQASLAEEFAGTFSRETVDEFVRGAAFEYRCTAGSELMAEFIHRYARELLQALAQSRGFLPKQSPTVLFVCVKNAGRSQMAAALLQQHSNGRMRARCAGTRPAAAFDPGVADVMAELGVSLEHAFPKPLHRELVEAADLVVTMGCGDACPILPGRVYEDWDLPDPTGMSLDQLRSLRDEIGRRVQDLVVRLTTARSDR